MHPACPKKSLTGLALGGGLVSSVHAGDMVNVTANLGDGMLVQLIYLPTGLLLAAVALELIARSKGSQQLHSGVCAVLAIAAACAIAALGLTFLTPQRTGNLVSPPPAGGSIGAALAGVTLLACTAKWFWLQNLGAAEAPAEKPSPKKRGRGRGRGRRHRKSIRTGSLFTMVANSIYLLSLSAAIALLAARSIIAEPSPPASQRLAEEAKPAPVNGSDSEDGPEPLPQASPSSNSAPPVVLVTEEKNHPESSALREEDLAPKPETVPAPATATDLAMNHIEAPLTELVGTAASDPESAVGSAPAPAPNTKPPSRSVRPVSMKKGGLAGAETYKKLVQPLLRSRCYSCHGDEKQKGDLRLDTPEGIRIGGKSGPAIIAGDAEKSYLFELIKLDASDDDIMPPKGKPLSGAQISWIGGWIREGADLGDGVAWPIAAGAQDTGLAIDALADGVESADSNAIQALLDSGVIVRQLSSGGHLLEIDYSHADRAAGDMRLGELHSLAANIHTLDLKRTKITDGDLAILGSMKNLRVLHLQRTKITDAGLSHLDGLGSLESLNLYNTQVSDAGLAVLKNLTSLQKVYLWSTQVTADGARDLAGVLGADAVNMGE